MSWRHAGTASNPPLHKGNRLKEVKLDPLDAVGLPSKGDERLLDFNVQEDYYRKILVRYTALQNANRQKDDEDDEDDEDAPLDQALNSLSIDDSGTAATATTSPHTKASTAKWPLPTTRLTTVKPSDAAELATLTSAMRKLREAIVASARADAFVLAVYIFIVRAAILTRQMEAYHPALLHLLRTLLPAAASLLAKAKLSLIESESESESESAARKVDPGCFLEYYVLDLACRQGDLGSAYYHLHHRQQVVRRARGDEDEDGKVEGLLRALVRGDWCLYWRQRERMDRYQRRLCEWGDERMRVHALNCLGAGYLSVRMEYAEQVARQAWTLEELRMVKPGWEVEGEVIVIKRVKKKT